MKYYKINQYGMSEILGINSEMVYCYNNLFRKEDLYLREDEEISISEIIENKTPSIEYSVRKGPKEKMYVDGYMYVFIGEEEFHICKVSNMKMNENSSLLKIYNKINKKISKTKFSIEKLKEGVYSLSEGIDYEEVSEKEYKDLKVKETFK
ncbi:hypothetical protein [Staphylococcus phage vB_StaM_PB50]|nr:hypothetical protein [Staphylococcus phage vB_StaM_PB50]